MKKYLSIIIASFITFIFPIYSFAQGINIKFQNPIQADSVSKVMTGFFKILVQLGAVAVTLAIVYAGFLFVVAKGNPEQLNKAKTTLFWTIIGALVLLGAEVIAKVVENTIKQL